VTDGRPPIDREVVEGYLFSADPFRLVLFRRPPDRGRIWVPVSGKVEADDVSFEEALRRELREETGLEHPLRVLPLDWEVVFDAPEGQGTWRLHAFAVEVDPGWTPTLSAEHEAFERVTVSEAVARLHYGDNREAVGRLVERLHPAGPADVGAPAGVFPTLGPALFDAVRRASPRRIVLQVPAGLVRNAHDMVEQVRSATGAPVVLAGRACFGACDVPTPEEGAHADVAIVLGHAPIPNMILPMRTFFVEMRQPGGSPIDLARLARARGLPDRLGVVASIQHLDLVSPLEAALTKEGFSIRVGRGDRRLAYAAQALGCNYTGAEAVAPEVDAFLFLGTGQFHPIGLALAVDRPVYALDPLQGTLEAPIDRGAIVRRRQLLVATVREARRWGILVSSFAGQNRTATALALQARARARGRQAEILSFSRLDPRDLEGRDLEAYVNTACPRIAIDDSSLYPRPVLTPPEFLMALGELPLEPYRFDTYH
jgi:2-(3-amino-3-carboxypropyl)histidine synthase